MKISKTTTDQVHHTARFEALTEHFLGKAKKSGSNLLYDCMYCGGKHKMSVSPAKQIMKCFSCGEHFKTPVHFVMKVRALEWIDAVKAVADFYNIIIQYDEVAATDKPAVKAKRDKIASFRDLQLKSSGLIEDDQKDLVFLDEITEKQIDLYSAGTMNEKFQVVDGDDMIMRYIGLDGKPMKYTRKGQSKEFELIRVRWQNPDVHLDKNGRPIKYQSPKNSGTAIWINRWVRDKFKSRSHIETLYIQEGEKKADKATKHGMISVGIMGIWNIAVNRMLPKEIEMIVKYCNVKNVVFVVDSDFNELSRNEDEAVDKRARGFLGAVQNFKDYFYALNKNGIHLELFFAYIKKPEGVKSKDADKGIDDLLVNTLKGKENDLLNDFNEAIQSKHGEGKWINCHRITGENHFGISKLFHLDSNVNFARLHHESLATRERFRIGREFWKFKKSEEGEIELELAQPLGADEQFWTEELHKNRNNDTHYVKYRYNFLNAKRFLFQRGFARYAHGSEGFIFIHVDNMVIREVKAHEIKDYMIKFTENIAYNLKKEDLANMILSGSRMYLGTEQLGNIDYLNPDFHTTDKAVQYLYFSENYWKITEEGITESPLKNLDGYIWHNKIRDFNAKKLETPLIKVEYKKPEGENSKRKKGEFTYTLSPEAENCHFQKYLWYTSNFYWEDDKTGLDESKLSALQLHEIKMHYLAKITAIGYLLHSFKDPSVAKAVIAMDGKMSEIGSSNGRSGKSLLGDAINEVVPSVYISGKQKDIAEDRFLFEEVNESTAVVYIDDVRVNFDFEHFFPMITGQMKIEAKGIRRYTPPKDKTPKFLITTNHAINGESGSFKDRQFLLAFSDWYHRKETSERRPIDDFGVMFFSEWDYNQKNLFFNFMANCIQIYLQHGLIEAPIERLEKRRQRQQIGEALLDWADEYFSNQNCLNCEIEKKDMYDSFAKANPTHTKYIDIRSFKKRLKIFCEYKGWILNPGKPEDGKDWGGDIKKGGIEYICVQPPTEHMLSLNEVSVTPLPTPIANASSNTNDDDQLPF